MITKETAKVYIHNVKGLPDGDWVENIIRAKNELRFQIYFWRAVALFFFLTTLVFAFGGETEECVKKAMAEDAVRLAYAQGQQDLILEAIE